MDPQYTHRIAIIGMSGRFPGADSVDALWDRLVSGTYAVPVAGDITGTLRLEGVELFDAEFFGLKPLEAAITDPQHRLLLECAWSALEDAGHRGDRSAQNVGVFVGGSPAWYAHRLYQSRQTLESVGLLQVMLGNDPHFLATRLSFKLNLQGPSLVLQSACSTSLLAVHYAAQSLLNGECEMAVAGGVGLTASCSSASDGSANAVFSSDGLCRAFDAAATGTVAGEGLGLVVLKRYADALRDRDPIRAVILGSAVNNDGSDKASFLAPSAAGQSRAMAEALALSGVSARSVGYVEAHGTATPIGDPIEFSALADAFRADTDDRQFCVLGSIKGNIGHLDAAAGVAGLIKCVLALEHRQIPATAHFRRPNPQIDLAGSPFRIERDAIDWPEGAQPRRAAVNACGFGGTNVHLVLEEAPPRPRSRVRAGQPELWLLSARSEPALRQSADRLATWLRVEGNADVADAAHTLRVGRRSFAHRRMVLAYSRAEAIEALASDAPSTLVNDDAVPRLSLRLRSVPLGSTVHDIFCRSVGGFAGLIERCSEACRPASLAGPALVFAEQWALATLLQEWGFKPATMSASGVCRFVVDCLGGVMTLSNALRLALNAEADDLLPPLRPGDVVTPDSETGLWQCLGGLWLRGIAIDWAAVVAPRCLGRQSLPGTVFQRTRHWIDEPGEQPAAASIDSPAPAAIGLDQIWAEQLGVTAARANGNFFDLGGDSLVAAQLISRIKRNLQVSVSMDKFFEDPTLAGLERAVRAAKRIAPGAPVARPAITRAASRAGVSS